MVRIGETNPAFLQRPVAIHPLHPLIITDQVTATDPLHALQNAAQLRHSLAQRIAGLVLGYRRAGRSIAASLCVAMLGRTVPPILDAASRCRINVVPSAQQSPIATGGG